MKGRGRTLRLAPEDIRQLPSNPLAQRAYLQQKGIQTLKSPDDQQETQLPHDAEENCSIYTDDTDSIKGDYTFTDSTVHIQPHEGD